MDVGDRLELRIDSVAYRGAGVARHAGCVVFVPGVCPGERVLARVGRVRRRYVEAVLEEVIEPSPDRIEPVCRVPGPDGARVRVPGCVYDHLDYAAELRIKQAQLTDFLVRHAGLESVEGLLSAPVASPRELRYRNKIVLHAQAAEGRLVLGYRGEDGRSVVDLPSCPLAVEPINARLAVLREALEAGAGEELRPGADVTLRWTAADGVRLWVGPPVRGAPPLREATRVGELEVPEGGFFQVNTEVADRLVEAVQRIARGIAPAVWIDAYCGVGVFALAAAEAGIERVLGIETGRQAVAAARRNARRLGREVEFACAEAGVGLRAAFESFGSASCGVVLDPPRAGLDASVREVLTTARPGWIVYVSCAPDTLARDLRELLAAGYRLEGAQLFDMFPRTAPFETLTLLVHEGFQAGPLVPGKGLTDSRERP